MYDRMIRDHGYSIRRLAEKLGKDKGYLENRLRLADAPPEVRAARVFAQGHPVPRLRADEGRGPEEAPRLADQVARNELSLVKLRERIEGRPARESPPEAEERRGRSPTSGRPSEEPTGWDQSRAGRDPDRATTAWSLAKQQLNEAVEELLDVIRSPDVLDAIGPTDRTNLAKYLTIAKLRLENAIAVDPDRRRGPLAGRPPLADTKKPAPDGAGFVLSVPPDWAGASQWFWWPCARPWRRRVRPCARPGRPPAAALAASALGLRRHPWPPASSASLPLARLGGGARLGRDGRPVDRRRSVASFMWATHETKAPWLRKPSGVSIWAAAETSAPWVSPSAASASASSSASGVLGRLLRRRASSVVGVLGPRRRARSRAPRTRPRRSPWTGPRRWACARREGWASGAGGEHAPADMASTTMAMARPRKRRMRSVIGMNASGSLCLSRRVTSARPGTC